MALSWSLFEPNLITVSLIAVVVSAWYGGRAPGLLSDAISFRITNYIFIEPYYAYAFENVTRVENQII